MGEAQVSCFSRAVNLRCTGLSRLQGVALVVPPAIQFIAALFLARSSLTHTKRKNSLIFVESFVYLALSVGEFGLHEAARTASSLSSFISTYATADRAVGALASLPLFSFVLFLYLFLHKFVLPYLPRLVQLMTQYIFISFIPLLVVFNELASLLSAAYGLVPTSSASPSSSVSIAQGYVSLASQSSSHAFTVVTLVILLLTGLISAALNVHLVYHMKHIESLGGSIPGTDFVTTVLLASGCMFAAVDTLVGFANQSFASVFARRIITAASRLCIIFALIKQSSVQSNPPSVVGISNTVSRDPLTGKYGGQKRKKGQPPNIRALIGNPRHSTFAHLNTSANGEMGRIRTLYDIGGDDTSNVLHSNSHRNFPSSYVRDQQNQYQPNQVSEMAGRRVTVQYDRVNPPILSVRFSSTSLPPIERTLALVTAGLGRSDSAGGVRRLKPNQTSGSQPTRANASLYRVRPEYFPPSATLGNFLEVDEEGETSNESENTNRDRGNEIGVALEGGVAGLRPQGRLVMEDVRVPPATAHTKRSMDEAGELAVVHDLTAQFPQTPSALRIGPVPKRANDADRNRAMQASLIADPFADGEAITVTHNHPRHPSSATQDSFLDMNDHTSQPPRLRPFRATEAIVSPTTASQASTSATSSFQLPVPQLSSSSTVTRSSTSSGSSGRLAFPRRSPTPPPRRTEVQHRRVPTAELAPLDVFRDRFAEQRQLRLSRDQNPSTTAVLQSHDRSGSYATMKTTTTGMTLPTLAMARAMRHGVSASVSSFFPDGEPIPVEPPLAPPPKLVQVNSRRDTPSPVVAPDDAGKRERSASFGVL